MLHNYISNSIKDELPFEPTDQQAELLDKLGEFIMAEDDTKIFLLKGYAGTGKTSVISAMVRALNIMKLKTVLLAPTGRAAKVISAYSGFPAFTIHKNIYRQKSLSEFKFQLSDNLNTNTLFIVDEASMISNTGLDNEFGSGRLLDDLIDFVYRQKSCSLILIGDTAQLPPVMQAFSPALEIDKLSSYGLNVHSYILTHVVRQALESGILFNATQLRNKIDDNLVYTFPKFDTAKFNDIKHLSGIDLIDEIQKAYSEVGINDTIVITRSNRQANLYNNGIRNQILMKEEEISNGDLLMVTKNNYFWSKPYKNIDFIANGDILEVVRVRQFKEMYGYRFLDLTLRSLDYDWEIDARIWLDILQTETPKQANELHQKLFALVAEDYPEITNKRNLVQKIYENEYFNSLQIKFSYAVTCHKAQGGQWKKVFIDSGQVKDDQINIDFYRWLYTALTRATESTFLVNFQSK